MDDINSLFRELNNLTSKLQSLEKEQLEIIIRINEVKEELDDEFDEKIKE